MKNVYMALLLIMYGLIAQADEVSSTCYGTTKHGRLANAVELPGQGKTIFPIAHWPALLEEPTSTVK
jgi:hypothetical protein